MSPPDDDAPADRPRPAEGPADPVTPLAEGASQLHELFMAYVSAGFTRAEALAIVIAVITANLKGGSS